MTLAPTIGASGATQSKNLSEGLKNCEIVKILWKKPSFRRKN
jgi:hypothetical protein